MALDLGESSAYFNLGNILMASISFVSDDHCDSSHTDHLKFHANLGTSGLWLYHKTRRMSTEHEKHLYWVITRHSGLSVAFKFIKCSKALKFMIKFN